MLLDESDPSSDLFVVFENITAAAAAVAAKCDGQAQPARCPTERWDANRSDEQSFRET